MVANKPIPANEMLTPILSATGDELAAAFSGPAIFTNKMYATNTPAGVRLAFCEWYPQEGIKPQVRTSILISYPDVVAFRDLLTRQLHGMEFLEIKPEEPKKDG